MKKRIFSLLSVGILIAVVACVASCSSDDNSNPPPIEETGTEILSNHVWITTRIVDNKSNTISLDVMPGAMYAGYAYYNPDGTFRIVDFEDGPKMYGLWELRDNDTKRHLVVYNAKNEIAYERTVDLVELTNTIFTYNIPDNTNPSLIYSVEHKPVTNHPEPKTPAELLASIAWETTRVLDITDGVDSAKEMDKTIAPAANFSGDAYYIDTNKGAYFPKNNEGKYVNGTFLITAYGDKNNIRSQGDWYVSLDGTERTLIARNDDGTVAFERTVPIYELTTSIFTYDIEVEGRVLRVEHKPIN